MANELFTVVPPQDALDVLLSHCAPIARTVTVPLADAFGRVTASVIHAAETLPAFVDRFFTRPIARRTLATFKALAEAITEDGTSDRTRPAYPKA